MFSFISQTCLAYTIFSLFKNMFHLWCWYIFSNREKTELNAAEKNVALINKNSKAIH